MRGSFHGYGMYSDEDLKEWIISNIYSISYSKLLSMQAAQIKASTYQTSPKLTTTCTLFMDYTLGQVMLVYQFDFSE